VFFLLEMLWFVAIYYTIWYLIARRLMSTIWCYNIMRKGVFYNWPCNSIVNFCRTFATHYIFGATHCNFVKTTHFQLLCNSIITTPMKSCWHHQLLSIHKILSCGTMKFFGHKFFLSIIMIVNDGLRLWHVAQFLKLPLGILIVFWKIKKKKLVVRQVIHNHR
jgi:hypothetical protein